MESKQINPSAINLFVENLRTSKFYLLPKIHKHALGHVFM